MIIFRKPIPLTYMVCPEAHTICFNLGDTLLRFFFLLVKKPTPLDFSVSYSLTLKRHRRFFPVLFFASCGFSPFLPL